MKANELMIGDWVQTPNGFRRVEELSSKNVIMEWHDYGCTVEDVLPIPLTKEILEKNGYHYEETYGIKQLYSEDGRVSFTSDPNYLNSQNMWSMHIDSEDMSTIGGVELTYVHEFQHMLRLCGIDKDINL